MQALYRVFEREIPLRLRIPALEGVTHSQLIYRGWFDIGPGGEYESCPLTCAAFAATNQRLTYDFHRHYPTDALKEAKLATMLEVPYYSVRAGWHEWEYSMNNKGRMKFLEDMCIALVMARAMLRGMLLAQTDAERRLVAPRVVIAS